MCRGAPHCAHSALLAKPIRLCLQQAVQCLLDAASHDLPQMIFYPTGVDTDHVRQALRVILVHGGSGLLYWLLRLTTESLRDSGPPTTHKCAKLSLRHLRTSRSSARRATISLSVMSLSVSIRPTMKPSCPSRLDPRRRPVGHGSTSPAFTRDIQRIAVDGATPNRAAAPRADMPACDAFKTRTRRSPLNTRPIQDLLVWRPSIRLASSRHIIIDSVIGASALAVK